MIDPVWALWGLLVPALIGTVSVAVMTWLCKSSSGSNIGSVIGWTVGPALGVFAGFVATYGWSRLQLHESQDWLVMAVLPVVVVVGVIANLKFIPTVVAWLLRAVVAGGAAPLLLQAQLSYTWTAEQAAIWLSVIGMVAFVLWIALHALARRKPVRLVPITAAIVTAATAVAIMLSGSIIIAQLGLAMSAAFAGAWVGSFIGGHNVARGFAGIAVVMLLGLILNGRFYVGLTTTQAALLAIAPLGTWVSQIPPLPQHRPWVRTITALIAASLPAAVALTLAVLANAAESDPYRGM